MDSSFEQSNPGVNSWWKSTALIKSHFSYNTDSCAIFFCDYFFIITNGKSIQLLLPKPPYSSVTSEVCSPCEHGTTKHRTVQLSAFCLNRLTSCILLSFVSDNLKSEKSSSFGPEKWKSILDKTEIFVYFKHFCQVLIVGNNLVLRKIDETENSVFPFKSINKKKEKKNLNYSINPQHVWLFHKNVKIITSALKLIMAEKNSYFFTHCLSVSPWIQKPLNTVTQVVPLSYEFPNLKPEDREKNQKQETSTTK